MSKIKIGGKTINILAPNKIRECPYCSTPCEADWVDVGVGEVQCGPFHCDNCGASEIGPHDKERQITNDEAKKGWYKPGSKPGSSANILNGKIVSAEQMKYAYQKKFKNNPKWEDKNYVYDWYEKHRGLKV